LPQGFLRNLTSVF